MKANWVVVLTPPLLVSMALLVGTQFVFLRLGFFKDLGIGQVGDELVIINYVRALSEPFFLNALARNFYLAIAVVGITLVVSYPIAYIVARMRARWAIVFVSAIVVSSFVSIVIKVLGIIIIFGANGPLNRALLWLGLLDDPISVIGTIPGVIIGLTHLGIAFMVMMLFSVIQAIPRSYEEAAEIHGASRLRVFWRIIIPQYCDWGFCLRIATRRRQSHDAAGCYSTHYSSLHRVRHGGRTVGHADALRVGD